MRKFSTWELKKVGDVSKDYNNDNSVNDGLCQCRYCGRMHRPLGRPPWKKDDIASLASFITNKITSHGNQTFALGEGWVVLRNETPKINISELAESIIEWMQTPRE